jgi:hypothetical protein
MSSNPVPPKKYHFFFESIVSTGSRFILPSYKMKNLGKIYESTMFMTVYTRHWKSLRTRKQMEWSLWLSYLPTLRDFQAMDQRQSSQEATNILLELKTQSKASVQARDTCKVPQSKSGTKTISGLSSLSWVFFRVLISAWVWGNIWAQRKGKRFPKGLEQKLSDSHIGFG